MRTRIRSDNSGCLFAHLVGFIGSFFLVELLFYGLRTEILSSGEYAWIILFCALFIVLLPIPAIELMIILNWFITRFRQDTEEYSHAGKAQEALLRRSKRKKHLKTALILLGCYLFLGAVLAVFGIMLQGDRSVPLFAYVILGLVIIMEIFLLFEVVGLIFVRSSVLFRIILSVMVVALLDILMLIMSTSR